MSGSEIFKTPLIPQKFTRMLETPKTPELSSEFAALLLKKESSDPLKVKLTFDTTEQLKPLDDCINDDKQTIEDAPVQSAFCVLPSSATRGRDFQHHLENKSAKECFGAARGVVTCNPLPVTFESGNRDVKGLVQPRSVESEEYPEVFSIPEISGSCRKNGDATSGSSCVKPTFARSLSWLNNKVPCQKPTKEQREQEARARIRKILMRQQSEPTFSSDDEENEKGIEGFPKPQQNQKPVVTTARETIPQTGCSSKEVSATPRNFPPANIPKRTPLMTLWQPHSLDNSKEGKPWNSSHLPGTMQCDKSKQKTSCHGPQSSTVPNKPKCAHADQNSAPSHKSQAVQTERFSFLICEQLTVNSKIYHIIGNLGKGGSSKVYQTLEEDSRALRAIKVVDLSPADHDSRIAYRKEVDFLIKLKDCQRVIHMIDYDYKEAEQMLYIVMEKGDSDLVHILRDLANGNEFCTYWQIKSYWYQMLKAVDEIHKKGIIHSDLKPANFIMASGKLKLIDFGIASALHSDMTSVIKDTQVGTINYMSPESLQVSTSLPQATGYKVRPKSDVWSLGCILYNLTYGHTPFQAIRNPMAKIQAISNPNFQIPFPTCKDEFLLDVLKKCLERDPSKRPNIEELLSHPYLTLR